MNEIIEGGLYTIGSERMLGLVVFAGGAPDLAGLDVRVIPAYAIKDTLASDRDVIVAAADNSLNEDVVLACWNARQISPADLVEMIGEVPEKYVQAARATELVGIVPGAENSFNELRGTAIRSDEDPRVEFQRSELQRWDDIMFRLDNYRNATTYSIARSQFQGRKLFEGKWVSGGPMPDSIVARGMLPTLRHALTTAGAGAVSVAYDDDTEPTRRVA